MIIALTIEQMINNMGHEVASKVVTGKDAVCKALKLQPDVILMDIRLKGSMDGIEAVQEIQNKKEIPVIYITGNRDPMYAQRVKQTHYIDFINKPVDQSRLMQSFDTSS